MGRSCGEPHPGLTLQETPKKIHLHSVDSDISSLYNVNNFRSVQGTRGCQFALRQKNFCTICRSENLIPLTGRKKVPTTRETGSRLAAKTELYLIEGAAHDRERKSSKVSHPSFRGDYTIRRGLGFSRLPSQGPKDGKGLINETQTSLQHKLPGFTPFCLNHRKSGLQVLSAKALSRVDRGIDFLSFRVISA
jgi:hypothetical protein